jgi:TonB family protein
MPEPASASAESVSREAPAYRLVIRAQIVADPIPAVPEPSLNTRALTLVAAGIVLLILGWVAFSAFGTDPAAGKIASAEPQDTTPPITAVIEPQPTPSAPQPDTPPQPVDRVTPTASPGALKTIRGTIRVAIAVTIDPHGRVIDAVATEPGPSRYFERVSLDASRQWTFTPASNDAPRRMLLRFHFTRAGATASVGDDTK